MHLYIRMGLLLLVASGMCISPARAGEVRIPIGSLSGGAVINAEIKSLKELREEGVVLQQLDYSCGASATATILTYHLGIACTEREVVEYILAHSKDPREVILRRGFTLLDLKQFAEAKGVQATGYRLTFAQLVELKKPVLLPILPEGRQLRHFVVLLGTQGDEVFLADPVTGRRTLTRAAFELQWDQKIGMVFTNPNAPVSSVNGWAIRPIDETSLSPAAVLATALPVAIFLYCTPLEF